MKIPIVLLNYNSSTDCAKCISLLKKQKGVNIEIVVVDNCSSEDDLTHLRALCQNNSQCTLIENRENHGYNAGNNIGLRYVANKGYKYALIANPDMEFPQADYLMRLVGKMEEDKQVVVCGSNIITPEGRHQNPMREITYFEELLWPITYLRFHRSGDWFMCNSIKSGYCTKVSGCCLFIRMSFIEEIGYFDEGVFLYSEESILAKQVEKSGNKMYYLTDAQAIHRHIKSKKGNPNKNLAILFSSRLYYLRNYSGFRGSKLGLLLLSKQIQKTTYKFLCFKS